ncbi:Bax inhibitor-1/YccA family protein [Flavobacterium cerinum]|uniref:Bax inhibitor-1/YccA family protein n=1 Tax=Flavobacterium cerinum TaxID=2502784 RepID=A0A3S3RJ04_9FLAO|nr:Bax inhibitor-1/YccA family protein [Flavobacterium cerinum]RWW99657.1 Bax inhibitor-1/YccA family protein [Flavobacterium cerinum]
MELKSNNPFLGSKAFKNAEAVDADGRTVLIDYNNTMTVSGAINKSFILLLLLLTGAFATWYMIINGANAFVPTIAGAILGFVAVIAASFKPQYSGYLAPAYAVFEGLFIGGISAVFESMYPGIVVQAVGGTFVTFAVCFALYRFKIVQVTEKFKSVVIAATLAIATYYIISILASWIFNFQMVGRSATDGSWMSIGISVFVIVIAALNLFLDFDLIEKGAQRKMPKYMEWFSAMGLMITLVWLYVEFLRLLSKISSRN